MSIFLFLIQKLKEKISKIKIFKLKYLSLKKRDRQTERERERERTGDRKSVYFCTNGIHKIRTRNGKHKRRTRNYDLTLSHITPTCC